MVSEKSFNTNPLIIDGTNLFIRNFIVSPATNDKGIHVGGLAGFLSSLGYVIRILMPTRCIIVFDGHGGSVRRRKIYPEYKEHRKSSIRFNRTETFGSSEKEFEAMKTQLVRMAYYLKCLPVTVIVANNIEADDAIAYTATELFRDSNVIILSSDKDFYQLVNERISIWDISKKSLVDENVILNRFGIHSKNMLMYRILEGDSSDNIPGIRGVGLKTAKKRLPILTENKELSVSDIIEFAEKNKGKYKVYDTILENKEVLMRNEKLMRLYPVSISADQKIKVQNKIEESPPRLDKLTLRKLFHVDMLQTAISNFDNLLDNFYLLNIHRAKAEKDSV